MLLRTLLFRMSADFAHNFRAYFLVKKINAMENVQLGYHINDFPAVTKLKENLTESEFQYNQITPKAFYVLKP